MVLNQAIQDKSVYSKKKEKKISELKARLSEDFTTAQLFDYNRSLYKEYRKFKIDSAIYYVKRNLQLAETAQDKDMRDEANLQLANLFSSSGKYRESELLLQSISRRGLSEKLLPVYYEFYSQFYEQYATNSYSELYVRHIEIYRDSLLSVLEPTSVKYRINMAQKDMYLNQVASAQGDLLALFSEEHHENADYAMVSFLIGCTYELQQNEALREKYFVISAIADIKNAIKDNASMQGLALSYFDSGNIDAAFLCTKSALEDAIFCNVKFRTLQMSELYSIINTAYLDKEAKGKTQLQQYLLLISLLSVFLIIAVVYVYKQMRRLSRIKEELHKSSLQLAALNKDISQANLQLSERNGQLFEANHIKEEYIAHFFDLCSAYITKLETYRKTLNKKANDKQLDELFRMLKSTTVVDNELEELYKNFDMIFLNLYPTFIRDFNSLLDKDEQVLPKAGELLNTELRIFALIRLGISDSVKIAAFLRYSLSTIYNYRTKARNKAIVAREDFEIMLSKIGSIPARNE